MRQGEAWTPRQRRKNLLLRALVRGLVAVAARLPAAILGPVGAALGALAWRGVPALRRDARRTLAAAYPEASPAERDERGRAALVHMGRILAETLTLLGGRTLPPLPADLAALDDAVAEGRGVVLPSAHLGPWERVAATLAARYEGFVAVGRESYDPALTSLYTRTRSALGVRCIFRGAPGSGAAMLRALRGAGVLGVPMDLRSRVPSLRVPFLGALAWTPVGPARLALRTGAAVVVATVARGEGGLRLTATRIPTADLAPDAAGEATLLRRINDELSARIRACPHLWVWPHRRFDPAPPELPRRPRSCRR